MSRKRKQASKSNKAVLPVMRADAAGIDIGATEIVQILRERRERNEHSPPPGPPALPRRLVLARVKR